MSSFRANLVLVLSAVLMAAPAFASRTHRKPAGSHSAVPSSHSATPSGKASASSGHSRNHNAASKSRRLRGQQAIDPSRVTEIQQALIREHYLATEADGKWDATTQAAMQKYQADQGWQTRLMPDSRALKKLGLGPDYSNAINAKTATFADPPPVSSIPAEQAQGFAQAAGVNR